MGSVGLYCSSLAETNDHETCIRRNSRIFFRHPNFKYVCSNKNSYLCSTFLRDDCHVYRWRDSYCLRRAPDQFHVCFVFHTALLMCIWLELCNGYLWDWNFFHNSWELPTIFAHLFRCFVLVALIYLKYVGLVWTEMSNSVQEGRAKSCIIYQLIPIRTFNHGSYFISDPRLEILEWNKFALRLLIGGSDFSQKLGNSPSERVLSCRCSQSAWTNQMKPTWAALGLANVYFTMGTSRLRLFCRLNCKLLTSWRYW